MYVTEIFRTYKIQKYNMQKSKLTASKEKDLRNQEIYMEIATGAKKDDICKKWDISLTQLNRILREANKESEKWFRSLPRQTMIQIFCNNSEKVFQEIRRLERIRNGIKEDPRVEFDMTLKIISAYSNYNKMVADGPALVRQKEVIEVAEKLQESNDK